VCTMMSNIVVVLLVVIAVELALIYAKIKR
jgi:hypothetical protein